MNQADFQVRTQSDGILRLDQAVLIYRGASANALAPVHQIEEVDGEPVILAGQAMTPRAAIQLARALSKGVAHGGFLPETVLYIDGDLLLWWVPPVKRHIMVSAPELGAPERGEIVPHPGLVFAASSSVWKVWAVKGKTRPTLQSALFQAPYFNVWEGGDICRGNVQVPDGTTAEKIDAWNAAFLNSFFTHPNVKAKLVRYRGGAYAFWRDMLDGRFKTFPERVLVDIKTTLGKLLGEGRAA
jgi:PRTRC genetic system protein B